MNNTFDIRRFVNYLLYDLRRAQSNYLISGLILGFMPLIFFVFVQFFSLVLSGEFTGSTSNFYAVMATVTAEIALIFTFPVKMYGPLTDKRFGSDWLMIPASTLEKWLSMVLMVCIIGPLAIAIVFLGVDTALSLCFKDLYGHSVISNYSMFMDALAKETDGTLTLNLGGICFLSLAESMLIFTLGALWFKKSKAAKTFLTLILVQMAGTSLLSAFAISGYPRLMNFAFSINDTSDFSQIADLINNLNIILNVWYLIVFTALLTAIYYRIKTLKH